MQLLFVVFPSSGCCQEWPLTTEGPPWDPSRLEEAQRASGPSMCHQGRQKGLPGVQGLKEQGLRAFLGAAVAYSA